MRNLSEVAYEIGAIGLRLNELVLEAAQASRAATEQVDTDSGYTLSCAAETASRALLEATDEYHTAHTLPEEH